MHANSLLHSDPQTHPATTNLLPKHLFQPIMLLALVTADHVSQSRICSHVAVIIRADNNARPLSLGEDREQVTAERIF
jgi:hypothetical protein